MSWESTNSMSFKISQFVVLAIFLLTGSYALADEGAPEGEPNPVVVLDTSLGQIELELDAKNAPISVANFLAYVDEGYYDGTLFHRLIPGFVIQGGGFETGMRKKETLSPIANESSNGLKNRRGTISMARSRAADSATSQFFINLARNSKLDPRPNNKGYAVFGSVIHGMSVVDRIAAMATTTVQIFKDVPVEDVLIQSARRMKGNHDHVHNDGPSDRAAAVVPSPEAAAGDESFELGTHYLALENPVATFDPSRVEVVEAFSYGCTHCYAMESLFAEWRSQQAADVVFSQLHAVWNPAMVLYAKAYYASIELGVIAKSHQPLFVAIVIEHQQLGDAESLAEFISEYGVEKDAFLKMFHSDEIARRVDAASALTAQYNLASVPEVVINGKYRVDPMRAGGRAQMLQVIDFLVAKERARIAE